jgi:hypothetical protein
MGENVPVTCPWCGENLELWVDRDTAGTLVQDCDVCCRPWQVHVSWEPDEHGGEQCHVFVARS